MITSEVVGSSVGNCKNPRKYNFCIRKQNTESSSMMPYGNCEYVLIFSVSLLVSVEFKALYVKIVFKMKQVPLSSFKDFCGCLQSILGSNFSDTKDNRIAARLPSECAF